MEKHVKIKEVILILLVLVVIKFGISILYNKSEFSIKNLKYSLYTSSLESLNTEELEAAVTDLSIDDEDISLIYVGRLTCPYCVEHISHIKDIFENFKKISVGGEEIKVKQFYFDSEKYNTIEALKIRDEIGAKYVPTIILINKGKISIFSSEEIGADEYLNNFSDLIIN